MLKTDQAHFFALITHACAEYLKAPTAAELESWWGTCKVFSLDDVERALKAHAMDPEDGKRMARPVDIKRRLSTASRAPHGDTVERYMTPELEQRIEAHRLVSIRSPSVRATAHAIALRHGNRPWWPDDRARFAIPAKGE